MLLFRWARLLARPRRCAFDKMKQCADDQNDINRLILNFDWAGEVFNRSQAEDELG
jgi:hypothetical protein